MKRILFSFVLVACGPNVATNDDAGDTTTDGSTTDATATTLATSVGTSATSATTVTTTTATATTATSAESTSADTSSSEGEADSSVFLPDPDSGCFEVCVECDVWAQDCQDGDKCMGWAHDGGNVWSGTRCTPIDPEAVPIGAPCAVEGSGVSGIDNCELGAICWGVDPLTNEGTCVPMCTQSEANPVCPEGLACTIAFEAPLIVCLPPCDPLAPTCAADEVCSTLDHLPRSDIRFACQPMPPFEPQPYGTACGGVQLCDEGLVCVPAEHVPGCAATDCCTQLGLTEAPPVCPDATQTCVPLDDGELCFCGVEA